MVCGGVGYKEEEEGVLRILLYCIDVVYGGWGGMGSYGIKSDWMGWYGMG